MFFRSSILLGGVLANQLVRPQVLSSPNLVSNQNWANDAQRPNFLVILTDDQDNHMGGYDHMPKLHETIIDKGANHPLHFCTIALCCPARATLWTGQQGHNNNVTALSPPYGGYPQVVDMGHNDNNFFTWMQAAGYELQQATAGGFNQSKLFVGNNVYTYYNVSYSINAGPIEYSNGYYSTDLINDTVLETGGYLDQAMRGDSPWLVVAAPVAPHVQTGGGGESAGSIPPPPAKKYANYFPNFTIPRTPDFNPDTPGGAGYYKLLPKLNDSVIEFNDEFQRQRMRALLSVDDMVGSMVERLEAAGQMNNTYIVFTTDNGFHISQHRLIGGKESGLETDIHIPFAVRGPGIQAGSINYEVTNHVDLAPTILALAGADLPAQLDGAIMTWTSNLTSMPLSKKSNETTSVEFWGNAQTNKIGPYASFFGSKGYRNNTFTSVRVVGADYGFYYSVWCTNEHEVYDMQADPYQLFNLFNDPMAQMNYTFANQDFNQTISRLDALLLTLKACKAEQCRTPWKTLFPSGNVTTLMDAMNPAYDSFFANQPKVLYTECLLGHVTAVEGPSIPEVYPSMSISEDWCESGPLLWE